MKLPELVSETQRHMNAIEDLVKANMPQKGDKPEYCQKLCVLQDLSNLRSSVAGIKAEDLH